MSFGGGAASGSGSGTGATAYTPTAQSAADTSYQNILHSMIDTSKAQVDAAGALGSPAIDAYTMAQPFAKQYISPNQYTQRGITDAVTAANYGEGPFWNQAQGGSANLYGAANQALSTGFDPQSAIYNQGQQRLLDQSNVANAMAGVARTPYGASVTSNALGNYDLGYQRDLANRQNQALGAAGPALTSAQNIGYSGATQMPYLGGRPYTTGTDYAATALPLLNAYGGMGNNLYALPQQTLSDLQSYMGLGQSASGLSGYLGNLGVNQQSNAIGGIGSLLGGLGGIAGLFL